MCVLELIKPFCTRQIRIYAIGIERKVAGKGVVVYI